MTLSSVSGVIELRPGRWCPPSYGLSRQLFHFAPVVEADVLYIAGGLYGNEVALARLVELLEQEPATRKAVILNGDYHWFDHSGEAFDRIETGTRAFIRLRGNVETELSSTGDEAGCGCGYPDGVSDEEVSRSNQIMSALKRTARSLGVADALSALPAVARARCGGLELAITHGDDRSLAGWSLAENELDATWMSGLPERIRSLGVSLIASSHTCLPVADTRELDGQTVGVINNGAAGLANFSGDHCGLITRIALRQYARDCVEAPMYAAWFGEVQVAAVPLRFDLQTWQQIFLEQWPPGSPAYESYWTRLSRGPSYSVGRAARDRFCADVC